MRYSIPLILGSLVLGCVAPEENIDDSTVRGTVVVPLTTYDEKKDRVNFDEIGVEVETPEIYAGYYEITGTIKTWGLDGETGELTEDADQDWFLVRTLQSGLVRGTFDVPGATEGTQVLLEIRDLENLTDPPGSRPVILLGGIYDTFPVSVEVELEKGHQYALAVGGAVGEGEQDYSAKMISLDPNDTGIKAGAYLPAEGGGAPDVTARGNPVAGGAVVDFELQEDFSFVGSYEMLLARSVVVEQVEDPEDTGDGFSTEYTVDENLDTVYVFALDGNNLNGLPAGTWYNTEPATVDLTADRTSDTGDESVEYLVAAPVTLDAFAPLVIGWELDEVEPNDIPVDPVALDPIDLSDPSVAQDVGMLSGPGFVDILRGTTPFDTADLGFVHDSDGFMFQVPSALEILFTLDWDDDAADVDMVIVNSEGLWVDYGATTAKPEVNVWGGSVLQPDEAYFLIVLGYSGTEGTAPAWELSLEQLGR